MWKDKKLFNQLADEAHELHNHGEFFVSAFRVEDITREEPQDITKESENK